MNSANKSWQQTQELSNNFWIRLLFICTRILPRSVIVTLLVPAIAFFYAVFASNASRSSKNFLRRVLKQNPGFWNTYRHIYTFAVTSVDRIYILSGNFKGIKFVIENDEKFRETSQHSAALLVTSHLGSYDIMRALGSRDLELPIHVLIDKHHNARAMSLLQSLDPELASRVIDAGQSGSQIILEMQSVISGNGMVGIMADRPGNDNRTFKVKFLDGWVHLPMGPWIFAYLLDVPIILCFGLLDENNCYHIYVEEIDSHREKKRASRDLIIEEWIHSYVKRLEHYVRKAPYNWFNFYDYWEDEST